MKRMWKKSHNPDGTGMYRSTGENCRRKESVLSAWKMRGTRKAPPDFCNTLCAVLYWQAAGRNTKECGNCRGADKKCLWKPDYGETGEALAQNRMDIIGVCGEVFCRNIRRAHRRAGYFPQRNRIIAGLADYVIVMEARKRADR